MKAAISFSVKMLENNWDKLLPDILILILYSFFLDPMMEWQLEHLAISCTILMVLNIAAVSFGCFSFFTLYAEKSQLFSYKNLIGNWERAALGISIFISILGFFWWLVPFAVVKELGVKNTGFAIGATIYFICFLGVVSNSIGNKKGIQLSNTKLVKVCNVFITTIFFFFSYSFLLMSMRQLQIKDPWQMFAGIICLLVFFLPLRLFLLLRPPRNRFEYILFIFSFCYMLYQLYAKQ